MTVPTPEPRPAPDVAIVCLTRCWSCQFGQHFDPPKAHTWMDDEDAAYAGLTWPLPEDVAAAHPCACRCAGGPGGCHAVAPALPVQDSAEQPRTLPDVPVQDRTEVI